MQKSTFLIVIFLTFNLAWSQSKEETLSYLNSFLKLKSDRIEYYSFVEDSNGSLTVHNLTYIGAEGSYLYFNFDAKNALYIGSSTDSKGETDILLSFKKDSVKLLYNLGDITKKELSDINLAPLISVSKSDVDKFTKAYKHMIKLYGGTVKEDPFK